MKLVSSLIAALLLVSLAAGQDPGKKSSASPGTAKQADKAAKPSASPKPSAKPADSAPSAIDSSASGAATDVRLQPAPEMKKLIHSMVGRWQVEEKYEPTEFVPKGGEGKATDVIRRGPGGMSIVTDYRSTGPMGNFVGHGIIAWELDEKIYKSFWVDSMDPGGSLSIGKWEGDDLIFTSTQNVMGKQLTTKQVYSDFKPDSFIAIFEMAPEGGQMKRIVSLKYTRMDSDAAPKPMHHGGGMHGQPLPDTVPEKPTLPK